MSDETFTLVDWDYEHSAALGVAPFWEFVDDMFPREPLIGPGDTRSDDGDVWFAQMTQVLARWLLVPDSGIPLILMDYEQSQVVGVRLARRESRADVVDVLMSFWMRTASTRNAALAKLAVGSSDLMKMNLTREVLGYAVSGLAEAGLLLSVPRRVRSDA